MPTLVYNGFWYAPERLALQALVTESQKKVSGTVRVKLYKGGIYNAGRKSKFSLYRADVATMEADPDQGLRPGRRHRLHPSQWSAPEDRRAA